MYEVMLYGLWRAVLSVLSTALFAFSMLLYSGFVSAAGGCGSASLPMDAISSVSSSSREGQFRMGLSTEYTDFDNFREGGDSVTNPGGNNAIIIESTLFFDLGLSERWSASMLVPYVEKQQQTNRFGERIAGGIGDITLLGRYDAINNTDSAGAQSLSLGLGLKFPTGSITEPGGDVPRLPPAFQVGSGAYDLVPTASYYRTIGEGGGLLADMLWRVPLGKNKFGYEFGQELEMNVGGEYTFSTWENTTFVLSLSYLHARHDTDNEFTLPPRVRDGTRVLNTGGEFVDLVPGIRIALSPQFSLQASVALPLYEDWNGDRANNVGQVAPDWSAQLTFVYSLSRAKNTTPHDHDLLPQLGTHPGPAR